ncbi:tetra-peptide repeat homeobox protein 1-like [Homarus americanus]|uniref:tetra-peptide repeat homeobox protein 1-like n=1 Tax=Homarus americanus TaxID=6706 RepID=UPI001C447509|nr:tetra-peptide repeat homeobox protein 1-like [Homarus americanus]
MSDGNPMGPARVFGAPIDSPICGGAPKGPTESAAPQGPSKRKLRPKGPYQGPFYGQFNPKGAARNSGAFRGPSRVAALPMAVPGEAAIPGALPGAAALPADLPGAVTLPGVRPGTAAP